jgi:hypothetical protein
LAAHGSEFPGGLPQMSNCYCLPGRAGGFPIIIRYDPPAKRRQKMARLRKSYGADFKAKVAIAAIKAEATTNELKIDDAWVMQVIAEAQEEERRNPMTTE